MIIKLLTIMTILITIVMIRINIGYIDDDYKSDDESDDVHDI